MDNAAYIFAQSACALIEMESMKVANRERRDRGESIAYTEDAFVNLINKYGIHHNAILALRENTRARG